MSPNRGLDSAKTSAKTCARNGVTACPKDLPHRARSIKRTSRCIASKARLGFAASSDSDGRGNPKDGSGSASVRNAVFLQVFRVLAYVFEVHQSGLPSGFQNTHDFGNGFAASFTVRDIVYRKIGHHGIHRGVREG